MKKQVTVIDIAPRSVKSMVVMPDDRDFVLESIGQAPSTGTREDTVRALLHLREMGKIPGDHVIVQFPFEAVIFRILRFPFNDPEKIATALPFKIEEAIPLSLDSVKTDYRMLPHGDGTGRVMLAAVRESELQEYAGIFREAGLEPRFMGIAPEAHAAALTQFDAAGPGDIIFIDSGDHNFQLTLLQEGTIAHARSLPLGGLVLTDKLMTEAGMDREDALRLTDRLFSMEQVEHIATWPAAEFANFGIKKKQYKSVASIFEDFMEKLVYHIDITISALKEEGISFAPESIYLSGMINRSGDAARILGDSFDAAVQRAPFPHEHPLEGDQNNYQVMLGLYLSYFNDQGNSINFLKGEFTPDFGSTSHRIYYLPAFFLSLSLFVGIVYVIIMLIISSSVVNRQREHIARHAVSCFKSAEAERAPLQYARKRLAQSRKELEKIENVISAQSITSLLYHVTTSLPENTKLQVRNMVVNDRVVRIDGTCDNAQAINLYKQKLTKTGIFESVTSSTRSVTGRDTTFTISISRKVKKK